MIGKILNDNYVLIKKIGEGTFASVWLCFDFNKKIYYAMKIFTHENHEFGENELQILKMINKSGSNNKNCVSYITSFNDCDLFCIVQELMVGSLYTIMKHQYPDGFSSSFVMSVMHDIGIALQYIHDELRIVHADIKPENILLVGHSIEIDNIIEQLSHFNDKKINNKKHDKRTKTKQAHNKTIREFSLFVKALYESKLSDMESETIDESECGSEFSEESISTDSDIQSSHSSTIGSEYLTSNKESDTETDLECNDTNIQQNNEYIVDKKFIELPRVILSDFGNWISIDDLNKRGDIQTRHYRAPEIILRLDLDEKIDIWAFGCTIFELMFGHVLFNSNKSNNISADLQQLYDIQSIFGLFPKNFFKSRKCNFFFRYKYLCETFKNIKFIDFDKYFDEKIKNKEMKNREMNDQGDVNDKKILKYELYEMIKINKCIKNILSYSFIYTNKYRISASHLISRL